MRPSTQTPELQELPQGPQADGPQCPEDSMPATASAGLGVAGRDEGNRTPTVPAPLHEAGGALTRKPSPQQVCC